MAAIKDRTRYSLALVLAGNLAAFYLLAKFGTLRAGDWRAVLEDWTVGIPAALLLVLVAIINAQLSPTAKSRAVFWRWDHPLPGCEAFTKHGPNDDRVDMQKLVGIQSPLPTLPDEQNALWYRWYQPLAGADSVVQAHREYLFFRDYAVVALLLIPLLGALALWRFDGAQVAWVYIAALIGQYLVVRRAAVQNGIGLVTNVLALKGAGA